jgi:hypothetical protein
VPTVSIYCPRCGQHQLSAEVRFCSRCGLRLENVEWLVATEGLVPVSVDPEPGMSPRRAGIRLGAKMLFFALVSLPITIGLSAAVNGPVPFLFSLLVLLLSVARMAYARLFEPASAGPERPAFPRSRQADALPPAPPRTPAARGATTGELQQPPSVTEHPTYLLDE